MQHWPFKSFYLCVYSWGPSALIAIFIALVLSLASERDLFIPRSTWEALIGCFSSPRLFGLLEILKKKVQMNIYKNDSVRFDIIIIINTHMDALNL